MLQQLPQTNMIRIILFFLLMQTLLYHFLSPTAAADENGPVNQPKFWLSPLIPISSESSTPESQDGKGNWLSRNKWWVALGAVVFGGAVAAAAAGGGGDEGGSSDGGDDNGAYRLDW